MSETEEGAREAHKTGTRKDSFKPRYRQQANAKAFEPCGLVTT